MKTLVLINKDCYKILLEFTNHFNSDDLYDADGFLSVDIIDIISNKMEVDYEVLKKVTIEDVVIYNESDLIKIHYE